MTHIDLHANMMRACAVAVVLAFAAQLYGCGLIIAGAAAGGAAGGVSLAKASEQHHYSPMTYAGTVLANIPYFPTKAIFAGLGAVASGVTYVATLGKSRLPNEIWDASVNGNYVLTPPMIEGDRPIHFVGETTHERYRG